VAYVQSVSEEHIGTGTEGQTIEELLLGAAELLLELDELLLDVAELLLTEDEELILHRSQSSRHSIDRLAPERLPPHPESFPFGPGQFCSRHGLLPASHFPSQLGSV
jgi:hypothetical protein